MCIDEEVFFGPISDKERKIREQFEMLHRNELNGLETSKIIEDDESQNSVYKSFSVEESKYDSFDDSLNEGIDKMPQEAKRITLRKSFDKIKSKRFYDSLEDVHSLASNIDKCSISCEVENESNLNSKHFVEDSLKILSVPVASKNNFINDQVHFDDDSLAILECATSFSDSLEEVNVLESIEIEEINDIENISMENQNMFTVEQHSTCPKNLFDTSVEIFCEKKNSDIADLEESFDEKNLLYDSLSNSDFKDILTDSLEEGKQPKEMLNLSKHATINVAHDKQNIMERHNNELLNVELNSLPNLFDTSVQILSTKHNSSNDINPEFLKNKNILYDSLSNSEVKDVSKDSLEESDKSNEILNISQQSNSDNFAKSGDVFQKQIDKENIIERHDNESLNVEQNSICPFPNIFDTSVQIISEEHKDSSGNNPKESLDDKNISCDSLLNSEVKYVSKDSLEKSDKLNEILNISQQNGGDNFVKSEDVYQKQNALETSVQIIYDNASNCFEKESINEINYNSKENFENNNFQETSDEQIKMDNCSAQPSASKTIDPSQKISENFENVDAVRNTLHSEPHINENKIKPAISVVSDPVITASANDISSITKEAFSVESCHLKFLNNDINIDKDLKFQLHIEVTVGDKKCQIASQDIKIVPVMSEGCKSEHDSISTASVTNPISHSISSAASHDERNDHVIHLNNQEINLKDKDCNVFRAHSPSEMNSRSHKKSETAFTFTSHITERVKSSASQTSCMKLNCRDSFHDVSLLQALDLPDLSASFLNESVIQSKDSLIPLNLYSPDECMQNFHIPQFKNKNKENIPKDMQMFETENFCARRKSSSPIKVYNSKTPQSLKKCSSFKETNKKTPGTKIPVRKVDNFAVPALTPSKFAKPFPATLSAEKVKKCQHSPHSVDSAKKTTPNKIPHICKVRNTIFSKVPQIIPPKKYMNVQSPVAQVCLCKFFSITLL